MITIRNCSSESGCPLVAPGPRGNGRVVRGGVVEHSFFGLVAGETIAVDRTGGVLDKWIASGRVVVVDLTVEEIASAPKSEILKRLPGSLAYDDVWFARDQICQRMHGCNAPRPEPEVETAVEVSVPALTSVPSKPTPGKRRG